MSESVYSQAEISSFAFIHLNGLVNSAYLNRESHHPVEGVPSITQSCHDDTLIYIFIFGGLLRRVAGLRQPPWSQLLEENMITHSYGLMVRRIFLYLSLMAP